MLQKGVDDDSYEVHYTFENCIEISYQVGYATENIQRPPIVTENPYQTALQFAEAANDNERLDDEGGGLLSGVNPRISLMQKLQRTEGSTPSTTSLMPGLAQALVPGMIPGMVLPTSGILCGYLRVVPSLRVTAGKHLNYSIDGTEFPFFSLSTNANSLFFIRTVAPISPNICLEPLFTAEDVAKEGPSLLDDIEEDVRTECSKFGLVLKVFINRRMLDKKVYVKFAVSGTH